MTLASGREDIWSGIAVDDSSVYWTEHEGEIPRFPFDNHSRVVKVPVGGGVVALLAGGQYYPSYVRVDATSVYWTTLSWGNRGEMFMPSFAAVMREPLDGGYIGTVISVDLDSEPSAYGDIAVTATSVYWTYQGNLVNDYRDGSILRVSLADGSTTTLATEQWRPEQIALDGGSVYWVNAGSVQPDSGGTSLMKMPLAGGAVTTLEVSPARGRVITLDSTYVYWASGDGTVMKIPIEGGAPVALAAGQSGPTQIAVDAASLYWANWDDGTIMKLPLEGGTPTTLVSGQRLIQSLAVDAGSVYWTTLGTADNDYRDGTVMKLTPK